MYGAISKCVSRSGEYNVDLKKGILSLVLNMQSTFYGKVWITIRFEFPSTIATKFIFNASTVQNVNYFGIHDMVLCSVSWIPDYNLKWNEISQFFGLVSHDLNLDAEVLGSIPRHRYNVFLFVYSIKIMYFNFSNLKIEILLILIHILFYLNFLFFNV